MMESINLLEDLQKLPTDDKYNNMPLKDMLSKFNMQKSNDIAIETVCGAEAAFLALFENRNIPDSLTDAYKASFTDSSTSLHEHYSEVLGKGEDSERGFISNLKGKVFEIELQDKLEHGYPDFDFSIATDPTNPVWDIKGINVHDGTEILIQAKMGGAEYTADVLEKMENAPPNVLFAVSSEIHDKIMATAPENVDVSNYHFTHDVKENLKLLTENMGIDVPDNVGEILPYVGEIILSIRLILDLISVQGDFKSVSATDKAKLSAVKSIVLISRFGVSTFCTFIGLTGGGTAGSCFPGPGNLIGGFAGSIGGAFVASKLNKYLKPRMMEFAFGLTGLTEDDMFYFHNKVRIDNLAMVFASMNL